MIKKILIVLSLTMAGLVPVLADAVPQNSFEKSPVMEKIGTYKCGRQPKQVLFSPDGKYIILPLLDDTGFDIFSVQEKKILRRVTPPQSQKLGFAEGLFIPEKNVFLVSQMTTGKLHEYSYPDFTFKRSISTEGTWSKFMVYSPEKNIIAVSNWVSNDVSIINFETGKVTLKIKTGAAPRGLWFLNDGKEILSLSFDDGVIEKFSTSDGKLLKSIKHEKAAMRHVVVNKDQSFAFISDMYHREILKLDLAQFKIAGTAKVFNNPNTIDLYADKYLFVSCRGPNNPEDYTKPSLVNGKIYILNTDDLSEVKSFEGGNQPTGLDVCENSAAEKFLCFSNFQDANIELYQIK